ncbi:MAG: NAD(P)/FAD-dependent oxidoreductase [Planctomycetes bacterium]|nr:NAD(P)/FAD-dependent oxidoreductase [Planctomycetota bacterium]
MPDRWRRLERDRFDAVVVGAGVGGLTAGALLARAGKRVLVVDGHTVAGGNTTVFRRRRWLFDVGLHYVGDCGPDGMVPRALRLAGAGPVEWRELDPDGFDTLHFPGLTFRVPRGFEAYRERLAAAFPSERAGIDRYVRLLRETWTLLEGTGGAFRWLRRLWRARLALRHAPRSLGEFLDGCTTDPLLRAVIAGQAGTYAQPPSRASLLMHAIVVGHYAQGAYYPAGGGQVVADRLAAAIERQGGALLLLTRATRIVVEGRRVKGVDLESHHLGRLRVRAPVVISNADLKRTLLDLVGPEHLRPGTVERTRGFEMSPSQGVVYLGLSRDLRAEGAPNTNLWVYPDADLEGQYAAAREERFHDAPFCYVSTASLKDPHEPRLAPPGHTNLQLMTVAPASPAAWGTTLEAQRSGAYRDAPAYQDAKAAFARRLLAQAERALPGLGASVVFQEVSTPLTHERYTRASGGTSYGIALTPGQSLHRRPGAACEVDGLFLCGASLRNGHGIAGAMLSGVFAAGAALRRNLYRELMSGRNRWRP